MRWLLPCLCLLGCSGATNAEPPPAPTPTAPASAAATEVPVPATLRHRVDLDLRLNAPTPVPGLGWTVELTAAEQVHRQDKARGLVADGRWTVRLTGAGPAQTLVFGRGQNAHTVRGHTLAIFGGTVLTVFPPGVAPAP